MSFEEQLLHAVGRVAAAHFGASSASDVARGVAAVSDAYTRHRERLRRLRGDASALEARLRFFLPRDLPKIEVPLGELHLADALPSRRTWRVLDLGAGLGTTTLGVARFAHRTGTADALSVLAVDDDAKALAVMTDLVRGIDTDGLVPIELETRVGDVTKLEPAQLGTRDLVVGGLVLNELTAGAASRSDEAAAVQIGRALIERWTRSLEDDGSVIVVEPALRDVSRRLQAIRDRLDESAGAPYVFAPCVRTGPCPMLAEARHWCHSEMLGRLPEPVAALARQAGLRDARRTLAHLTVRRHPGTLAAAHRGRGAPFRLVSAPLRSKGKLELVLCGAPGLVKLVRLDRHATPQNAWLERGVRGSLLVLDEGSVRDGKVRIEPDVRVGPLQRTE